MNGISTAQGGVAGEDHAGRLVHRAQFPVYIGEVLQATTGNKLQDTGELDSNGGRGGRGGTHV